MVGSLVAGVSFVLLLGAVALMTIRSARPHGHAVGPADDVFDDLGPVLRFPALRRLELPGHPWRFALLVAAAAAAPVALGGIVDSDPFDGLLRAATEIAAVLGCFAVFGRSLGLRRS